MRRGRPGGSKREGGKARSFVERVRSVALICKRRGKKKSSDEGGGVGVLLFNGGGESIDCGEKGPCVGKLCRRR